MSRAYWFLARYFELDFRSVTVGSSTKTSGKILGPGGRSAVSLEVIQMTAQNGSGRRAPAAATQLTRGQRDGGTTRPQLESRPVSSATVTLTYRGSGCVTASAKPGKGPNRQTPVLTGRPRSGPNWCSSPPPAGPCHALGRRFAAALSSYANNRWLRRPGPWPGAGAVTFLGRPGRKRHVHAPVTSVRDNGASAAAGAIFARAEGHLRALASGQTSSDGHCRPSPPSASLEFGGLHK